MFVIVYTYSSEFVDWYVHGWKQFVQKTRLNNTPLWSYGHSFWKDHWYLEGFHTSLPVISMQSLGTPCGIQRSMCSVQWHITWGIIPHTLPFVTSISLYTKYSVAKCHFKNVASSALWKHVNNRNETRVHLKWLGTIARAIADDNSTLTAQGKTVRGITKPIKHSRQSN